VRLWETASAKERLVIPAKRKITSLSFAVDGKRLAIGEPKTVIIVNAASGKELLRLDNDARVAAIAFSPDGKRLAVGGGETELGKAGGVKLWDLFSGREVLSLGSGKSVAHVLFSPDGTSLVAGFAQPMMVSMFSPSRPAEVKIWTAAP
jgi:WD40 repeat protein